MAQPAVSLVQMMRTDVAERALLGLRGAILHLDARSLARAELVKAFALATRIKAMIERRVTALRKPIDEAFAALEPAMAPGVAEQRMEEEWGEGRPIAVRRANAAAFAKVLNPDRAKALCEAKGVNVRRAVFEQPPRPPQPDRCFSPTKFQGLIAKGRITQAEYDACFDPAPPSCSVTVDVPAEFDEAIAKVLLRAGEP